MNQYLNIKGKPFILSYFPQLPVFNGQPSQKVSDVQTFTGKNEHEVNAINKRDVYWGLFDEQVPKTKEKVTDEVGNYIFFFFIL